ncbi:MAG: GNAT family N-acetyltransferase [Planctomycetes bacterium]|nr:GNAT family N-acetyltransferase [Planctomycetota bacterium]
MDPLVLLDRTHGELLLAANRASPIVADFTFVFERAPDFFAWTDLVFDRVRYGGAFHDGRLVAYAMTGIVEGWTGSRFGPFFYLGDVRVLPAARGERIGERLAAWLLEGLPPEVTLGYGLVKEGNRPAEHVLATADRRGIRIGMLAPFEAVSLLLVRRPRFARSVEVRRARPEEIPAAAALLERAHEGRLFAPPPGRWILPGDEVWVALRAGEVAGAITVRDLDRARRVLVLSYSLRGRLLRLAYAAGTRLFSGGPPLPAPGEPFRALTVRRQAVEGNDPDILRDLLAAVVEAGIAGGYHLVHVGFAAYDQPRPATDAFLANRFRSTIYSFDRRGDAQLAPPAVDLAMI